MFDPESVAHFYDTRCCGWACVGTVCSESPAHDNEYVHRDDYDQLLALYREAKEKAEKYLLAINKGRQFETITDAMNRDQSQFGPATRKL